MPMSRWPTCDLPLHPRGTWLATTPLLEQCLSSVRHEVTVHAELGTTNLPMGAHESVLEAVQRRLDKTPNAMTVRRRTVEHVLGTFKHWMGYTHFLTRRLANVGTEMSLHVLAYNLTRVLRILGFKRTMKAMRL